MKETNFIDQNKRNGKNLKELQEKRKTRQLSNLFIQVTDDLSYAALFIE